MPVLPDTLPNRTNNAFGTINVLVAAATGGDAPLTYSMTGLPTGLAFNATTRRITGSPTSPGQVRTVTYRVRDDDGDTDSVSFTWTIRDRVPVLPANFPAQSTQIGTSVSFSLRPAQGGDPPLTYTVTGLPTGLAFNATTRLITGTPTSVRSYTVRYTVRDRDGDTDSRSFTWNITAVPPPPDLMPSLPADAPTLQNKTNNAFSSISIRFPGASSGDLPLTYAVTGLPAGLVFNPTTRVVSGSATLPGQVRTVTYRVTDDDGDSDAVSFTWTIRDRMPALTGNFPNRTNNAFEAITPIVFAAASGGDPALTYSMTGLPGGYMFDPATREVSGEATVPGQIRQTRYRATDRDGDTVDATFTWTIRDRRPVLADDFPDRTDNAYEQLDVTLSEATGGDPPLTYSLTGLPTGLEFDPATRRVTGEATSPGQAREVRYRVQDRDGDTDDVTFNWTILDSLPVLPNIENRATQEGADVDLTLPAAVGGNAPLVYSITGPSLGTRIQR